MLIGQSSAAPRQGALPPACPSTSAAVPAGTAGDKVAGPCGHTVEEYDGVSGSGRWRTAVGIGARAVCVSWVGQPVRRRADPWARWEQAVGSQSRNAAGTLCMCVCVCMGRSCLLALGLGASRGMGGEGSGGLLVPWGAGQGRGLLLQGACPAVISLWPSGDTHTPPHSCQRAQ